MYTPITPTTYLFCYLKMSFRRLNHGFCSGVSPPLYKMQFDLIRVKSFVHFKHLKTLVPPLSHIHMHSSLQVQTCLLFLSCVCYLEPAGPCTDPHPPSFTVQANNEVLCSSSSFRLFAVTTQDMKHRCHLLWSWFMETNVTSFINLHLTSHINGFDIKLSLFLFKRAFVDVGDGYCHVQTGGRHINSTAV